MKQQSRPSLAPASWERISTAEQIADLLREQIIDGRLAPGTRLSDQELSREFDVSRNTLRDALRLLSHERLLVQELHRGVFVAWLSADDVRDLYRVRRLVEPAALRQAGQAPPGALDAVRAAVEEGERAAATRDWTAVGTANMHFHDALIGLAGSQRLDELMRRPLAELRLVFHVRPELEAFHEPYLAVNREIVDLLDAGEPARAEDVLLDYFDRAERQLLAAFAEMDAPAGRQRGARVGR
ncbi:MAG: GntR family transcriptional regulator [Pseudonocardiaceae bacterium]